MDNPDEKNQDLNQNAGDENGKAGEMSEKSAMKIEKLANVLGLPVSEVMEQKMSKKHLKRLIKNKRWTETKEERRKVERERKKRKRKAIKEKLRVETGSGIIPKQVYTLMKDSPNKVTVAIDLQFESYMDDRELRKLMKQVQRCYSLNRRSTSPLQLYLTSCSGATKERLHKLQPGLIEIFQLTFIMMIDFFRVSKLGYELF